ncbi:MAG: hypothetical protein IT288_01385 [Bdellovibrionales bacterium]|nr:hypothetical protein [Bdellovibrionales bacterium]
MKFGVKSGIPILLIVFALGWTADSILTQYQFARLSPRDRLQYLWNRDFAALQRANSVPPGWYHLKEIVYLGGDPMAKLWINEGLRSPHPIAESGSYRLDVMVLTFEEDNQLGAIIQYNLVNLKTSNMEWERGRTFILSGAPSEWDEWVATSKSWLRQMLKTTKAPNTKPSLDQPPQAPPPKPHPQAPPAKPHPQGS